MEMVDKPLIRHAPEACWWQRSGPGGWLFANHWSKAKGSLVLISDRVGEVSNWLAENIGSMTTAKREFSGALESGWCPFSKSIIFQICDLWKSGLCLIIKLTFGSELPLSDLFALEPKSKEKGNTTNSTVSSSIQMPSHLSIHLSLCPSFHLSIHIQYVHLSICPSTIISLFIHLFICLSTHPFNHYILMQYVSGTTLVARNKIVREIRSPQIEER